MKKLLFCLSFLMGASVHAQDTKCITQVNFNMGKTLSTFMYADANGNPNESLSTRSGASYSLNVGLQLGSKHLLKPELIYQEMGAKSSVNNTLNEWILNYFGAGVGYYYTTLQKAAFSLSPGVVVNANYMISGEQVIGNNRFNIVDQKLLKPLDVVSSVALNARFKVTDNMHVNFDYRYGFGLLDIENIEGDESEKTRNTGHLASLGLSFNL